MGLRLPLARFFDKLNIELTDGLRSDLEVMETISGDCGREFEDIDPDERG